MPSFPPISHLSAGKEGNLKEQIWMADPDKKTKEALMQVDKVREKLSVQEYVEFAKILNTEFLVSPSEQILSQTGKRKKIKSSLQSLSNLRTVIDKWDSNSKLLMPVWMDIAGSDHDYSRDNYLGQIQTILTEEIGKKLSGIMLYGLQNEELTAL